MMVQCPEATLPPPPSDAPSAATRGHRPQTSSRAGGGRREAHRRATQLAIRRAAFRLIEERGYEAASTEEIARLAGVSPRTFFNYFPSKELLFLLPQQPLVQIITDSLHSRPRSEDPAASLAAAAMDLVRAVNVLAGTDDADVALTGIRILANNPSCRWILDERRAVAEQAAWSVLVERGVSADDVSARAAVTAIVAVTLLALGLWAGRGGQEPLPVIAARCLLGLPGPSRLASAFAGDPA